MGLSDEEVARRDAAYAVKKAEELERRRIEDLERSQREEEQRAFEEAFRVEPRNSPIIVELSLANEICFPVEGGGRLRFGPGDLAGCLQFENATFDEEVNVLKITQVFKDVRSRAWKSVSFVTWESLLAEVLGSQRGESGGGIHLWNDLPEAWQKSMREACLISGATELLVRRDYYSLKLGDRTFTVREKYQTPTIDLAWLSAGNSMLIRVSNLYAVPDEDEGEAEDIPPFVFDLPVSKVGLPTNPGIHWRNAEDWLHFDGDDHRAPEFFLAAASDSFPVSRIEFLDP
jgi:hypothetical protein